MKEEAEAATTKDASNETDARPEPVYPDAPVFDFSVEQAMMSALDAARTAAMLYRDEATEARSKLAYVEAQLADARRYCTAQTAEIVQLRVARDEVARALRGNGMTGEVERNYEAIPGEIERLWSDYHDTIDENSRLRVAASILQKLVAEDTVFLHKDGDYMVWYFTTNNGSDRFIRLDQTEFDFLTAAAAVTGTGDTP